MSDVTHEQLQNAVAMQKLNSDTDYIKLQLTNMNDQLKTFATKAEMSEMRNDFLKQIQDIYKLVDKRDQEMYRLMDKHNNDDAENFGSLRKDTKNLLKIVWTATGGAVIIAWTLGILVQRFWR